MSYIVEHVRFTLECDVCGETEKRVVKDSEKAEGLKGWGLIETPQQRFFCCPPCQEVVNHFLNRRARIELERKAKEQAECEHTWMPRGLLQQCSKCSKWK